MCSHYQAIKDAERLRRRFGVQAPPGLDKHDVWPGYGALFIRRPAEAASPREALTGLFGLVPRWAKDLKIGRRNYNARSETVAEKPSFRDAWRHGRHCIVPADSFYEPDWRSGKPVPTRITRADGEPMGLAGIWSSWRAPDGAVVHSFSMLTINAADHRLMRNFHKPTDEKRMVVILPESAYDNWLKASPEQSMVFLVPYPAERMVATA